MLRNYINTFKNLFASSPVFQWLCSFDNLRLTHALYTRFTTLSRCPLTVVAVPWNACKLLGLSVVTPEPGLQSLGPFIFGWEDGPVYYLPLVLSVVRNGTLWTLHVKSRLCSFTLRYCMDWQISQIWYVLTDWQISQFWLVMIVNITIYNVQRP